MPDVAQGVFGVHLRQAVAYAELLACEGERRGLIGPRELPRLWQRHLLNCAVVTDAIPRDARVADIGSGAGLPGLVLAIRRPDLLVTLIEPMARRIEFLAEAIAQLGLHNVVVCRGRAEEVADTHGTGGRLRFEVVTSRAVAPLGRLTRWSLPLVASGGVMLAMKGSSAEREIVEHGAAIKRAGGGEAQILHVGGQVLDEPVTLIRVGRAKGARH